MNGIVWLARSGAPWRDLPERYGSWKTVYSRFRKWIDDGILDNIFHILSLEAELEELSIDASIIQAHQHSAGAKKGDDAMVVETYGNVPVKLFEGCYDNIKVTTPEDVRLATNLVRVRKIFHKLHILHDKLIYMQMKAYKKRFKEKKQKK